MEVDDTQANHAAKNEGWRVKSRVAHHLPQVVGDSGGSRMAVAAAAAASRTMERGREDRGGSRSSDGTYLRGVSNGERAGKRLQLTLYECCPLTQSRERCSRG